MAKDLKSVLQHRWGEDWLIGQDSQAFWQDLSRFHQELSHGKEQPSPWIVADPEPLKFFARFCAACSLGKSVLLGNPHWGSYEWRQVKRVVESLPDGSALETVQARQTADSLTTPSKILIPTGGSSGQLKFVVHTWQTLSTSVRGFQRHFQLDQMNAYCVLPLFHVSGLMQGLRVLLSGGQLALQPYQDLKQGILLPLPDPAFLSLVPTQLQWLLQPHNHFIPWLKSFRAVLLGGAPAWPSLLQQAREAEIPLALTYGMTETASQVATLLPEQFLAGSTSNGLPLPHARVYILGKAQHPLDPGQVGQVAIEAESLALGYVYPTFPAEVTPLEENQLGRGVGSDPALSQRFLTDDMGFLDSGGELHIVGRKSSKLITGGENVFPEEIESVLRTLDGIGDSCVVGLPDEHWGQRLCAVVTLVTPGCRLADLATTVAHQLAAYKCPKDWIVVRTLPRTPQGKINRQHILDLAQKILDQ